MKTKQAAALAVALALAAGADAARASDPLAKAIDAVLDRPAFAAAFWAVEVRSLKSGRVLYARDAGKNMTPASTMKLVTTAAALDALGPDARVRTSLESAGRLDALGRVLGDVFLVGRGEPLLSRVGADGRTALDRLADQLKAAGVARIEGRLVGHEGFFKGERRGEDWEWGDLVWCYGAEVSALAWNENCANLEIRAGERVGEPVLVDREPWSRHYEVISAATTSAAGTESDLTLVRELGSNLILLSGTHPIGAPPEELAVALEDPARFTAQVLAEKLEARGVRLTGGVATSSDPLPLGARVLAVQDGPPLAELIAEINKPSRNLHTEMLLRRLGAQVKGEGSAAAGLEALSLFLRRLNTGVSSALKDGSGLSRTDLVSPHDLVSLLVAMDHHPHAAVFRQSLAIAGVDGTLEHRLKGAPTQGRVLAKTGTLDSANALAGYVTTRSGERLAFAIVLNHMAARSRDGVEAIDAVVAKLAGR